MTITPANSQNNLSMRIKTPKSDSDSTKLESTQSGSTALKVIQSLKKTENSTKFLIGYAALNGLEWGASSVRTDDKTKTYLSGSELSYNDMPEEKLVSDNTCKMDKLPVKLDTTEEVDKAASHETPKTETAINLQGLRTQGARNQAINIISRILAYFFGKNKPVISSPLYDTLITNQSYTILNDRHEIEIALTTLAKKLNDHITNEEDLMHKIDVLADACINLRKISEYSDDNAIFIINLAILSCKARYETGSGAKAIERILSEVNHIRLLSVPSDCNATDKSEILMLINLAKTIFADYTAIKQFVSNIPQNPASTKEFNELIAHDLLGISNLTSNFGKNILELNKKIGAIALSVGANNGNSPGARVDFS